MKRFSAFALALLFHGVLAIGVVTYAAERSQKPGVQKQSRTINRGGPLLERLSASDADITVIANRWRGLEVGPREGRALISFWLSDAASAVVAELSQGESRLTAGQDFIETDWIAQPKQLLRVAAGHPLGDGTAIRFTSETGDLRLAGVMVHARLGWARQFVPGKAYLLFVFWDKKRSAPIVSPSNAYRILDDGGLERVDLLPNGLSQMTAKEAIAEVKEWTRVNGGNR